MKKKIAAGVVLLLCAGQAWAGWDLDLETGYVNAGYNDVQIPGNTGTRFSLTDDVSTSGSMYYRVRATAGIGRDQYISFLYAPLTLDASGTANAAINFNGEVFAAAAPLTGKYRFDSYRVTWYKAFASGERFRYKLGFTVKIRDAAIRLSDGSKTSEKKNTGFVPLLNFGAQYDITNSLTVLLDGDALAGGPGRAEDVLLAGAYRLSDRYSFRLGYRIVEGGADTDEVYNFALLNYLSAAVVMSF